MPATTCCNIWPSMARRPPAPRSPPISATPATVNRFLADDDDEDVRAELAVKIARLMPGLSERESAHIFALTIETLECLARDAAVRVRAILAEEIKHLDCIPKDDRADAGARSGTASWPRRSWNIRRCCPMPTWSRSSPAARCRKS